MNAVKQRPLKAISHQMPPSLVLYIGGTSKTAIHSKLVPVQQRYRLPTNQKETKRDFCTERGRIDQPGGLGGLPCPIWLFEDDHLLMLLYISEFMLCLHKPTCTKIEMCRASPIKPYRVRPSHYCGVMCGCSCRSSPTDHLTHYSPVSPAPPPSQPDHNTRYFLAISHCPPPHPAHVLRDHSSPYSTTSRKSVPPPACSRT
nr:hypothetical protein CFP56_56877 [Quercus suber]